MPALPRFALLRLAAMIAMAVQQARLLPVAVARANLTAGGDALRPPQFLTSPSGSFAFGFLARDSDPTKFILATWFRFGDGNSSQSQPLPQSVVWFAKNTEETGMGTTPNATARSVLSITADGHLTLTDDGSNQALWRASTPSMQRGSVLSLSDSGNVRFVGDGESVLWESFWYPTDTLLPGQSLSPSSLFAGLLFSKRADAEFTTGRFSLAAQGDGNVVLCVDLFTGDILHNAYWATGTNGPNGNTTVTFDDQGFLNYTLYDGTVHTLISPATSSTASSNYFQFARMDPDGIVRTYVRPKTGGGNTSWTVSGVLPGDGGCNKATGLRQGLCGPGSYCVETKERLSCLCPSGYTYVDAQHSDSGCTPEFEPQRCGEDSWENYSDEFSLVEMPNTTWEISTYNKKFRSLATEEQCREYCLSDCFCSAALMIGGSDCAEVGALTYGRQADDVTTTMLIKVRKGNSSFTDKLSARSRTILRPYKIVTVCLGFLLVITIGSLVAQHYLTRKRESQMLLSSNVRAFSWKELYDATNGFKKLLGKGNFGEVYKGTIRLPQPHLIAVKKLIDSNEYSEQEFTNEVQSIGQIHHRMMPALPRFALLHLATMIAIMVVPQARMLPVAVAARTNLTAGDVLGPPDYITSPSGSFAFGFRAHDSDPTKFLLATWFRFGDDGNSPQPQPQSVVWFAKESPMGTAPNATAGSVLSIPADGRLTLTDGSKVLWKAPSMQRGSVLVLRDSGNAQFLSDGGNVLWESFGYPTDTLLPGQSLEGMLFSKRADAEFTTGRFSLAAQNDGNVVLCIDLFTGDIGQNAYWATGTNRPGGNTTITFDDRGDLSYTLYGGTVHSLISPSTTSSTAGSNYFQFARMDPDGIVRTYVRPKNGGETTSWTVSGTLPSEGACNTKTSRMQGMCGPGSYCVETKERLNCLCPSGYTYIDAQHRDSGCTPAFEPQSCGGDSGKNSSDEFSLEKMPNTTWEVSIYYKKFPSVTEEQCREYCLSDCFCAAALMIDGSDCAEVGALAYGRQGNDVMTYALIKVRKGNASYTDRQSARTRAVLRPFKIISICLAFILVTTGGGLVAHHYLTRNRDSQQPLSSSVRAFSWKELYQATNGFNELLGKGSFGQVYKGTMRSPQMLIAVKKLIDSNEYSEQEFTNEVQSIGQIHHRNLVRMIGYCKEGKHRMLVFEFMPGGSLRSSLFNKDKRPPWRWRAEAALAIARGIEYLHDGCIAPIIHCDIKPDNILLDDRGIPRITDFGISKLLGSQQVHTTVTHVRGTRGYIAPEWLRGDARVDTKADVYSFGVVLLEIISCRKCQEPVTPDHPQEAEDDETVTLFGWAAQLVGERRTELMLHGDADVDAVEDKERAEQFTRVALWCIEPNPLLRPTMHQVVQMLETSKRIQREALPDPSDRYLESSPLIPQLKID